MVEQGLKATIIPEIDDEGTKKFMKDFQELVGNAYINIGVNPEINQPSVQQTTTVPNVSAGPVQTGETPLTPEEKDSAKPLDKEEMQEAVKEGSKEADTQQSQNSQVQDDKAQPVKKGLGDILGQVGSVASSVFAGGIGIVTYAQKIWDFFESFSPALKTVMDLFNTAFNMIWQPIGTIMAKELMPLLSEVFVKVATWMSRAWDIYDTEGWSGLIKEAVSVALDVLVTFLLGFGKVLWPVLASLGEFVLDLFLEHILGIRGGLSTLINIGQMVMSGINTFVDILKSIWNVISGVFEGVGSAIGEFVSNPGDYIVNTITSAPSNIWNAVTDFVPFLAEGGVVNRPTLSVVGEAGPEAIIPLNQLSQIANQYSSSNIGGNVTGGNVMNFYITGSNATEIGGEVQRILEKTVGKASSKMMWW